MHLWAEWTCSYRFCLQVVLLVQLHVGPHAAVAVQALALILLAAHEESGSATLALARAAGLWHHSPRQKVSVSRRAIARQHSAWAATQVWEGHRAPAWLCPAWSLEVCLGDDGVWKQVKRLSKWKWTGCSDVVCCFPWTRFRMNHTSAANHQTSF